MAKDKVKGGPANRHSHARVTFLQRAAAYLASPGVAINTEDLSRPPPTDTTGLQPKHVKREADADKRNTSRFTCSASSVLSMHLNTHLQQVARKSQIRLRTEVKRSLCKKCNTVLTAPGASCRYVENLSKDGDKPHADVLVITCSACATSKRFPVGAKRQKRKSERARRQEDKRPGEPGSDVDHAQIAQEEAPE